MLDKLVSVGSPLSTTQASKALNKNESHSESFAETLDKSKAKPDRSAIEKTVSSKNESSRPIEKEKSGTESKTNLNEAKAEKKETKASKKKADVQEEEISKFMDSIESELGIDPARMAEVLQKISGQDFQKSPKASLEQVSESLNLTPVQQERFVQLTENLVTQLKTPGTQDQSLSDQFFGTKKAEAAALLVALKAHAEARGSSMMVENPLMREQLQALGASTDLPKHIDSALLKPLSAERSLAVDGRNTLSELQAQGWKDANSIEGKDQLRQQISQMNERFWMKSNEMKDPTASFVSGAMNPHQALVANASSSDIGASPPMGEANLFSVTPQESIPASAGVGALSAGMNDFSFSSEADSDDSLSQEGGESSANALAALTGHQPHRLHALAGGDFAAALGAGALAQPMTANEQQNLQQLMNQAALLIKDGGGEMKVQMSPEGLGQVELKVLMQDGKLNIEMLTESKEAKKLIESQMTDLKMGLASQKLSVDNVKIDVVPKMNTENSANQFMQMNSGQQDQQQQLRDMWTQFNNNFGSQARRNSYFDLSSSKENAVERNPLQPINTSSSKPRKVMGKGDGLNLVA